MFVDVVVWFASLLMILLASVLFTNGIEILGHRLKMHQNAVGSILAAVGTAVERLWGFRRFLLIYVAALVGGNVASLAGLPAHTVPLSARPWTSRTATPPRMSTAGITIMRRPSARVTPTRRTRSS